MANLKRLNNFLDTPNKRIGGLLFFIAILIWLGTALHWNVFNEGFIHQQLHIETEKTPKPADVEGAFWRDENDRFGWVLYNRACIDLISHDNHMAYLSPPDTCRMQSIPHKQHFHSTLETSIGDYLDNLLNKHGSYFWLNITAVSIFVIGLLIFSGLLQKIYGWVKNG